MKITHIATINGGQDGAILDSLLFRFSARGEGRVYDLSDIDFDGEAKELPPIAEFTLDRADLICPHSNSVVFGTEYFEEGDEFPLLFSNVYNNYAREEDKKVGVCCVYRIYREADSFRSTLVGTVEIGFTDDRTLWRSKGDTVDVRPYGNFVIDHENDLYYAYVMRDGEKETAFFSFPMPKITSAPTDENGLRRIVLTKEDIKTTFSTPYHNYMQGSVCHKGKILVVEGFHERIHPALRIIDAQTRSEELFLDLFDVGFVHEPELIDFYGEKCIYGDAVGNLFLIEV